MNVKMASWLRPLVWAAAVGCGMLLCGPGAAQESPPAEAAPAPAEAGETHAEPHDAHAPSHGGGAHHGGDGEHHDPYDLSELNAAPGSNYRQVSVSGSDPLLDPVEWRFDMALFTLAVALVLFGALAKFAWKPIVQGLDQRESAIAAMIDEARNNQEVAAQKLKEYEARLAQATEEAQSIVAKAKSDAAASAERILADAEAAAARQRERAIADIGAAKSAALSEIAEKSVDAALGLAGNIVGKQLHREEHEELIRDALNRFPAKT